MTFITWTLDRLMEALFLNFFLSSVPGFSKTRNFGPLPFPQINNNWSIQRFISLRGNLHNLHNWRMINNHENILTYYGFKHGWTPCWWRKTTHNHYHITVFECMSSVCACPSWTGAINWLPSPSQALRIYTVGKWCKLPLVTLAVVAQALQKIGVISALS